MQSVSIDSATDFLPITSPYTSTPQINLHNSDPVQHYATVCPSYATMCPSFATVCPSYATMCPSLATMCPSFATVCPS